VPTFDLDAFDAFDPLERPGEQLLRWEIWERERPWRDDPAPGAAPGQRPAGEAGSAPATPD
jgi:hypothetical protein